MKRQIREPELVRDLRRIFPLIFWQECHNCNMEFVRELGWSILVARHGDGSALRFCICQECAPNADEAKAIALKTLRPYVDISAC